MPLKNTEKSTNIVSFVLILLIVAVLFFIWGNSLESIPESQAKSLGMLKLLTPLLEPIVGVGNVTDHLVRKLAHFIEFGVLGALLTLYAAMHGRIRLQAVMNCIFFGLATAVIDESIQLTSARGAQVQDILLDFFGALAGIALVWLIHTLTARIMRKA